MKRLLLTLGYCLALMTIVFGQERKSNTLEISDLFEMKEQGTSKVDISSFTISQAVKEQLMLSTAKKVELMIPGETIGKTSAIKLLLEQQPDSFYDYTVVLASGKRYKGDKSKGIYYTGKVANSKLNSIVGLAVFPDDIMLTLESEETGSKGLTKNLDSSYRFMDTTDETACDMVDEFGTETENYEVKEYVNSNNSNPVHKCLRLFFETDYNIFQKQPSVAAIERTVLQQFNLVQQGFANDEISVTFSFVKIWDIDDGYLHFDDAPGPADWQRSYQERDAWADELSIRYVNQVPGNLYQLIDDYGGDLGQKFEFASKANGIAFLDPVDLYCDSDKKNKLSILRYKNILAWTTTQGTTGSIHEFGHTLGCWHANICNWGSNNNQAFTDCGPNLTCSSVANGVPALSIMAQCGGNARLAYGFGCQPKRRILNYLVNASCIPECEEQCEDYIPELVLTTNVNNGEIDEQDEAVLITASNQLFSGAIGDYTGGEAVDLKTNFVAHAGTDFVARIDPCLTNVPGHIYIDEAADCFPNNNNNSNVASIEMEIRTPAQEISLYPNPASDRLHLNGLIENGEYSIISSLGQNVGYGVLNSNGQIDISHLPKGFYLLKIHQESEIQTLKFVKQ